MSQGQGLLRRPRGGMVSSPGPQLFPMEEGKWKGCPLGGAGGGWAGAEQHSHPHHTATSVCVASAGRGTVRMGSGC